MCVGGGHSHLPPLNLRFGGLAGTAGAAGLLLQKLDVGLLAGCRESGGGERKDETHPCFKHELLTVY